MRGFASMDITCSDVQYDFLPDGGSLAVAGGKEIIPVIEQLLDTSAGWPWSKVVASQVSRPCRTLTLCTSSCPSQMRQQHEERVLTDSEHSKSRLLASHLVQKDYHPRGHVSFATSHVGYEDKPFTEIEVTGRTGKQRIKQMLWPEHCVSHSIGRIHWRLSAVIGGDYCGISPTGLHPVYCVRPVLNVPFTLHHRSKERKGAKLRKQ